MDGIEERKRAGGMGVGAKIGIVAVLIVVVAAVIFVKNGKPEAGKAQAQAATPAPQQATAVAPKEPAKVALPKLVDLGADKCVPCKMMAPILDGLKKEYAGKLDVVFIDVWKNEDAGKQYGIQMIPTQIFFDAAGKELFRHEGFFAKEDILAKWKELGVGLN
jgi:thioredoxin 1